VGNRLNKVIVTDKLQDVIGIFPAVGSPAWFAY